MIDIHGLYRRKKDSKRGITYTMLLVGSSGTGKTTFANNLLESKIFPHRYSSEAPQSTGNKYVKLTKPTKVVTFNSNNGIPSYMISFDPENSSLEPGITITSTSFEILNSFNEDISEPNKHLNHDKILFNIIDTHGFGENLDNEMCFNEITNYIEQQFDLALAEETRIRRNPRFEDTRVHIALYFLEPTGHGLRELDVEMIKKLSNYTNVLPIISRADSFTQKELNTFKKNIMNDIEKFNVPIYKFEVDSDEDDLETIEENQNLSMLQPFSIICSDSKDSNGAYSRIYPWGRVAIDDDQLSDLSVLKNVLFGSHLQEFKDTTQNVLYENYRAEKLSSVAEWNIENNNSKNANPHSATPSLSNFTSLLTTGKFKSQQSFGLSPYPNTPSTPQSNSKFENNEDDSPIRQLSQSIKYENEEIIKNIKKSPRLVSGSPDRSKLRNISETLPYVLKHERILARQQKLQELEAQSARDLQKRIQELEKKAMELKLKEKMLKQHHDNNSNLSFSSTKAGSSTATVTSPSEVIKDEESTELDSIASFLQ